MNDNKRYTIAVEVLVWVEAPDDETARDMAHDELNNNGWVVRETRVFNKKDTQ